MEEEKPLFAKLGEKFQPLEIMALMKGDLSKVPNLV